MKKALLLTALLALVAPTCALSAEAVMASPPLMSPAWNDA